VICYRPLLTTGLVLGSLFDCTVTNIIHESQFSLNISTTNRYNFLLFDSDYNPQSREYFSATVKGTSNSYINISDNKQVCASNFQFSDRLSSFKRRASRVSKSVIAVRTPTTDVRETKYIRSSILNEPKYAAPKD